VFRRDTIEECVKTNCSFGFKLETDGSGNDHGIAVTDLTIQKVVDGATATNIIDGTSMATPHVAGIVAMAWTVAPSKSYTEIRDAVINSGDDIVALDGNTTTGRAADARKAIEAANDAPTAPDESVSTSEGSSVDVDINGSDPNGHTVSYSIASGPSDGAVSLSGNTATYEPDDGFSGTDSFSVRVADDFTGASTTTVSVDVESSDGGGGGGGGGGAIGWLLIVTGLVGCSAAATRRSRAI